MLKPFSAILVVALIAVAITARAGSDDAVGATPHPVAADAGRFQLSMPGRKMCVVRLAEAVTSDKGAIATGDCVLLYPEIAAVSGWVETGEGAIRLVDRQGRPVIVFAASDGTAFEAIEPGNSLLRLKPAI